jgi:PKD repeat protein
MGLTAVGDTLFFSAMNPELTAQVLWKVETAGPPLEVTVHNVPPAADAGADQTVTVGMAVSFAGSFTDPGTLDVHTVTWDFGDGTPVVTDGLEPTHTFGDAGVYTVTLTVTDDDGGVSSDQLTVNVITAEQQILLIGQQIAALVESDLLRENDAKPLNTSLDHALGKLLDGDTHVGINSLQAFQRKVQALLNSERISAEDGQALLAAAQAAIDSALFVAESNENTAFAALGDDDFSWLGLEDDLISELAADQNSRVGKGKGER